MLLYVSITLNIIFFILIFLMLFYAEIRKSIRVLIADAEQRIPGKTGEEKMNWVLTQIRQSYLFSKLLSTNLLKQMVENALKIMKDFSEKK